MASFTLHAAHGSTNTARVLLTLAEANVANYKTVYLNLATGEQKTPAHLLRHPFGKIPTLTLPSGVTLFESRAICAYIATTTHPTLLPPPHDHLATAYFDQASNVEAFYFAPPAGTIAFEKFAKRFIGLPCDESVVAKALKELESFFDVQEAVLGGQEWMAGCSFSLVDIYYVPLVERLFVCGYGELVMRRTKVREWWERCTARPAISGFLAAEREAARARGK